MDYHEFIEQRKEVSGGEVVMRRTRVPLRTLLASLAQGDNFEQLMSAFPSLTEDHLRAAVAFAAASALEDQPVPAIPHVR